MQEEFYGKPIILADRELVESRADEMLDAASTGNAAMLVVGDPYGYVPSVQPACASACLLTAPSRPATTAAQRYYPRGPGTARA